MIRNGPSAIKQWATSENRPSSASWKLRRSASLDDADADAEELTASIPLVLDVTERPAAPMPLQKPVRR